MTSTTPPRRRPPAATHNPVAGLLHEITQDAGRPRLTWYGDDGERIELSGHVLDNWVTKTANLLVEEFEVGPWSRVLVDLGVHWRTVVWALAVWRTGATLVLPGAPETLTGPLAPRRAGHDDVVVTARPEAHPGATDLVAVALPGLARSFDGPLPPGATDAASAVMTYGDVLTFMPEPELDAPALLHAGGQVSLLGLLDWAGVNTDSQPPARRVLVETTDDDVAPVLAAALSTYATDGSIILCSPGATTELRADPERRARVLASERVDD